MKNHKKTFSLNKLTYAVSMGLVATATVMAAQQAHAAYQTIGDLEIYQPAADSTTTLMLLLDISGSMNLGYSAMDDYNLTAGDGPQDGNHYRRIASPILDALSTRPANRPPNNTITMRDSRNHYREEWARSITDLGGYTRAQLNTEITEYFGWSPGSYCQTASARTARRRGATWTPTYITETPAMTGRGYERQYCHVPVDATTIESKYWANTGGATVGASWIMDPVIGCPMYTATGVMTTEVANATHRRCYSRMSRLKDALWDVINGNPSAGIAPLGDNVVLGMATLGTYLRNVGPQGWRPDSPLFGRMGWFHRNTGAIRVPARPLGYVDPTTGKTQRQLLIELIQDRAIFEAYGSTPTARSFAETAAYMLGTNTTDTFTLRETHLMDNNWAHRTCIRWGSAVSVADMGVTNWDTSLTPPLQCVQWQLASAAGINGDINYIDGYPVPANRANEPIAWRTTNNPRIYYGYTPQSGSGFPFSSNDSKTPDGKNYQAPASVVNQQHPECSGQGIYVLSDGAPSTLFNEEATMKLALGNKGSSFSCRGSFADNNANSDWACMNALSEALLDPTRNPAGISFKTAVVGFAREYTDQTFTPYDSTKTKAENLAGIPSNNNSTMARFARWGINGEGGWYAGSSSQSVVDSINNFVRALTVTIPTSPAGTISIPKDPLSANNIQPYAYLPMLQPEVSKNFTTWQGNLKKYHTKNGTLYGKDGTTRLYVTSPNATVENTNYPYAINKNAMDIWQAAPAADGDNSALSVGGAKSKLTIPSSANRDDVRTVYVESLNNAGQPTMVKVGVSGGLLVGFDDLDNRYTMQDKIYILNFLGYSIPVTATPASHTDLENLVGAATFNDVNLGGVMHSVPVLASYGGEFASNGNITSDETKREDYLLYGSMDGALHMVDAREGRENFAFIPRAMFDDQEQRHALLVNSTYAKVGQPKFGVDAPWSTRAKYSYEFTANPATVKADKMFAYGGLRMGGIGFYGLDISNRNNPKLAFSMTNATSGFERLGQTWAKPVVATIKTGAGATDTKEVLIFGGGYDMCYENPLFQLNDASNTDPNCVNKAQAQGNAVYMIDAENGSLIGSWTASGGSDDRQYMKHSIVGEITTLDRNNNGYVDHLYFADLGGQVFRIDLREGAAGSSLTRRVVRVFDANAGMSASHVPYRFYEKPVISFYDYGGVRTGLVNIASGDRSSPLSKNRTLTDANRIYGIFDRDLATVKLTRNSTTMSQMLSRGITNSQLTHLDPQAIENRTDAYRKSLIDDMKTAVTSNSATVNNQGWYYDMIRFDGRINVPYLKSVGAGMVSGSIYYASVYSPEYNYGQVDGCSAKISGGTERQMYCLPWGICAHDNGILTTGSKNGTLGYLKAGQGIQEIAMTTVTNTIGQSTRFTTIVGQQSLAEVAQSAGGSRTGSPGSDSGFTGSDNQTGIESGQGTGSDLYGNRPLTESNYALRVERWYDLQNSENN